VIRQLVDCKINSSCFFRGRFWKEVERQCARHGRAINPGLLESVDAGDRHKCIKRINGGPCRCNPALKIIVKPAAIGQQVFRNQITLELPGKKGIVVPFRPIELPEKKSGAREDTTQIKMA
jgi:hypothetical protein